MSREREESNRDRRELEERIRSLEWQNENKERKGRKRNIIIKVVQGKEEDIEKEIKEFIKDNIEVEVELRKAKIMRSGGSRQIIVAKLSKWDEKKEIMIRERNLKQGVYVEDDLTREERIIQNELRKVAREQREKG